MCETNYLLFPHTVFSEIELRHMAILFPQLSMLQICRRPAVPEWAHGIVQTRPAITEEQANQTRLLLREYRHFASLIGDTGALSSMSRSSDEEMWRESRFRIQSRLKGKDRNKTIDMDLSATLEASVFLEMAGELDQQGMELRNNIAQAENLEREFFDIVGINSEETDKEDTLEVADRRLPSENYSDYLPAKRLGFWLRLYARATPEEMPILVTMTSAVVAEIVDPLVNINNPAGDPGLVVFRTTLPSMPMLRSLNDEEFGKMLVNLRDSDILLAHWESLGRVVSNPEDLSGVEQLAKTSARLHRLLAAFDPAQDTGGRGASRLSIIAGPDLTIRDLWQRFDQNSSEITASNAVLDKPATVVLYERECAR